MKNHHSFQHGLTTNINKRISPLISTLLIVLVMILGGGFPIAANAVMVADITLSGRNNLVIRNCNNISVVVVRTQDEMMPWRLPMPIYFRLRLGLELFGRGQGQFSTIGYIPPYSPLSNTLITNVVARNNGNYTIFTELNGQVARSETMLSNGSCLPDLVATFVTCQPIGLAADRQHYCQVIAENRGIDPAGQHEMSFRALIPNNGIALTEVGDSNRQLGNDNTTGQVNCRRISLRKLAIISLRSHQ